MIGSPYAKCASSKGKWEYKNLEKFESLKKFKKSDFENLEEIQEVIE